MRCKYCHNRDTWDTHDGKEVTVEEIISEAKSYRHFMNASGGGVTCSGGEAMLQPEFVRDFFRAAKAEGIHTCLFYVHQKLTVAAYQWGLFFKHFECEL